MFASNLSIKNTKRNIKGFEEERKIDYIKGSNIKGRYLEGLKPSKQISEIREEEGEKITQKAFPGKSNNIIHQTRKVEVFKNQQQKQGTKYIENSYRYTQDLKESGRYTAEGLKIRKEYTELPNEKGLRNPLRRVQQITNNKHFREENGIDKYWIKEKMAQIWLDESMKTTTNRLSFIGEAQYPNAYGIRGTAGARGSSFDSRTNNLLNIIKQKDIELNKIVNQLKSQMNKNKAYNYQTESYNNKTTLASLKKSEKFDKTNFYESKINELLKIIKEKDDKVNILINQLKSQINTTNIYEIGNRTLNDREKRINQYSMNTRGIDTNLSTNITNRYKTQTTQSYVKNSYSFG